MHRVKRLQLHLLPHYSWLLETALPLLCAVVIFTSQAYAVIRFTDRSLVVYDVTPSATTTYRINLTYTTTTSIGSLNLLFCKDPIPTEPCVTPPGLNAANAVLSAQTGETGYSITQRSTNHLVLSRTPSVVGNTPSSYTFDNIVNPSNTQQSYSIRLSDYASTDASGTAVDLGSVISAAQASISIETQVAPILNFCLAQTVSEDCSDISDINYTNMGTLSPSKTLTASSQMAAGTNASSGFAITVNGPPMEAGSTVINPPGSPAASITGISQFGINLRANSTPSIGGDPDGPFLNANPTANYNTPNKFMYKDGDVVASAPNVSLMRRFTVSYIVNSPPNLRPGVYTTTLTFICTGRF